MPNNKTQQHGLIRGSLRNAKDPRHGTGGGYTYHKCRCNKCKDYIRQYNKEMRERRFAALRPEDHGKSSTYTNAGCRCEKCLVANRAYSKARSRTASQSNLPKGALVNWEKMA